MAVTDALRRLHNDIKLELLKDACERSGAPRNAYVLDLGCGVGGDIVKYLRCNASYVLGVDICRKSIEEAKRRLRSTSVPENVSIVFAALEHTSVDLPFMLYPDTYHVISCQFALHFLAEEPEFDRLLIVLAKAMRKGGVFVCTILQGDFVDELMGSLTTYDSKLLNIERLGDRVQFMLKEGTRYFDGQASREKLLYPEDIVQKFIDSGMRLLYWKNFRDYFCNANSYPEELKTISRLYSAFAFQKK